jgi:hypothetical protein
MYWLDWERPYWLHSDAGSRRDWVSELISYLRAGMSSFFFDCHLWPFTFLGFLRAWGLDFIYMLHWERSNWLHSDCWSRYRVPSVPGCSIDFLLMFWLSSFTLLSPFWASCVMWRDFIYMLHWERPYWLHSDCWSRYRVLGAPSTFFWCFIASSWTSDDYNVADRHTSLLRIFWCFIASSWTSDDYGVADRHTSLLRIFWCFIASSWTSDDYNVADRHTSLLRIFWSCIASSWTSDDYGVADHDRHTSLMRIFCLVVWKGLDASFVPVRRLDFLPCSEHGRDTAPSRCTILRRHNCWHWVSSLSLGVLGCWVRLPSISNDF